MSGVKKIETIFSNEQKLLLDLNITNTSNSLISALDSSTLFPYAENLIVHEYRTEKTTQKATCGGELPTSFPGLFPSQFPKGKALGMRLVGCSSLSVGRSVLY